MNKSPWWFVWGCIFIGAFLGVFYFAPLFLTGS